MRIAWPYRRPRQDYCVIFIQYSWCVQSNDTVDNGTSMQHCICKTSKPRKTDSAVISQSLRKVKCYVTSQQAILSPSLPSSLPREDCFSASLLFAPLSSFPQALHPLSGRSTLFHFILNFSFLFSTSTMGQGTTRRFSAFSSTVGAIASSVNWSTWTDVRALRVLVFTGLFSLIRPAPDD